MTDNGVTSMRRIVPGARVTVAQLLAELADGLSLSELEKDRDWSYAGMRDALLELARDIDGGMPARSIDAGSVMPEQPSDSDWDDFADDQALVDGSPTGNLSDDMRIAFNAGYALAIRTALAKEQAGE